MAESLASVWMSATIPVSITQFNSIHLYYVYHGPKSSARLCWEIEINKIRSFTQIKDLVVKRLGSWGVRLLAKKTNVCFFVPNHKAITKVLPDRSHMCIALAKQFHWREMQSKTRPSGWSCSLHLCFPGPGTFNPRFLCFGTRSEIFFRCLCQGLLMGGGRRRGKPWRHFSPLWLSTQYFHTPSSSHLCPGPRAHKTAGAFCLGPLNSEATPSSRVHLTLDQCAISKGKKK